MYCINCGVRLDDAQQKCPLCQTEVVHPKIKLSGEPLYPQNRTPKLNKPSKAFNGAVLILFFIPLIISLIADLQTGGGITWFGYVAGALLVAYVAFALPLWFVKPNPVIFTPCFFAAVGAYLLYIDLVTGGGWFLSFAFPVTGGLCAISCAVVALLRYVKKGKLYIWGGAFIALGALMLLTEFLLGATFGNGFAGWSVYPLAGFALIGGFMIYLGINRTARQVMQRKLFF